MKDDIEREALIRGKNDEFKATLEKLSEKVINYLHSQMEIFEETKYKVFRKGT